MTLEGDDITHHVSVQIDPQLTAVVHRLAVERRYHVAGAQPGSISRAAGAHIGQHDAALARQRETRARIESPVTGSGISTCSAAHRLPRGRS